MPPQRRPLPPCLPLHHVPPCLLPPSPCLPRAAASALPLHAASSLPLHAASNLHLRAMAAVGASMPQATLGARGRPRAVTLPSSPTPFPVATTTSRRCLFLRSPPPRRALRVATSAAAEASPKPPTSPFGTVLVDPSEAQKVHRLKVVYDQKVVPIITEEFGYTNAHQVPKLEKIVVNCRLGTDAGNSKGPEVTMKDLAMITGQWPIKTKAKKSVASFKIREGNIIGIAVTLRGRARGVAFIHGGGAMSSHG